MAHARELKGQWTQDIADIEAQIRAKRAEHEMQGRIDDQKWRVYQQWKARATTAKQHRQQQLTRLRAWMVEHAGSHRATKTLAAVDPNNPDDLIVLAHNVIRSMGSRIDYQYTPDEQTVCDMLDAYINNM